MGYTKDTIKGVSWVGAFRVSSRGIAIIRTIILARILSPTQFGVVGIATLVLGFIEMFTETGINIFLVQEKKIDRFINTAWIVSIVRGFFIALIIIISAPFVAQFFNALQALFLLFLISIVPIIRGFINPAIVRFQKDLAFGREFWFRFAIFTIDSLTAITLALVTREAASIVFGFIVGAIAEVILSFVLVRPTPKLSFNRESFSKILHRGKWVTAFSVLNYGFQNIDAIVVGRLLGTSSLGLYQVGYRIAAIPTEVVDSISRVTFPVYTKISNDKERLRKAFLKTIGATSFLTIPFGIILFLFTEELVTFFLGITWLNVVPALKILSVFGIVRALMFASSPLFLSVKKQEYVTIVTLLGVVGLGVSVVPLVSSFGMIGAALAAFTGILLSIPVVLYFVWRVFR